MASTSTLDNFIDDDGEGQECREVAMLMKSVPMVNTYTDETHALKLTNQQEALEIPKSTFLVHNGDNVQHSTTTGESRT